MFRQIKDFAMEFSKAEYLAHGAMLFEPDYEVFRQYKRDLESFAPAFLLSSSLARFPEEALPADRDEQLKSVVARQLLRLELYQLANGREIYAAYMTGTYPSKRTGIPVAKTSVRYLLENTQNGWQIISRDYAPNVGFPYWETVGGEDITLPDKADDVVVYKEEAS